MKKIYERKVVEQGEFIKFLVFFKIGKGTTKKNHSFKQNTIATDF